VIKLKDDQIWEYIKQHNGRTPKRKIMSDLGLTDEREFRESISRLRMKGKPILSVSGKNPGYYIPNSLDEVDAGLHEFISRTIKLRMVYKGIKQGLDERFPGNQIKLDLGA
jgi:hypothetical protein